MRSLAFIPRFFDLSWSSLSKDALAGSTVAIVALPLALGFGITSGMSASAGLTTAIIAGFVAALFGGSKYQVSGPTGAMTVVLIPIIAKYGINAIPLLGLLAGLMVILMALFRTGRVINRIPWPVVEGFTVGIAFIIALQQLPLIFQIGKGEGESTVAVAINTIKSAVSSGLHWKSIGIVVLTLCIKFLYPRLSRLLHIKAHIPASFVAIVVVSIVVSALSIDVANIGEIPRKIGSWSLDGIQWNQTQALIWPAFLIALLCAIESLLSARVADGMVHAQGEERYKPDNELFGQGLATIASVIFGGMPATGAIARTSVNVRSGARSRLASIIHAIVLIFVALMLGTIVTQIPTAAIAGVLLGTSYRILNPVALRESLQTTKSDATVLIVTSCATVAIDLIWGIAIGISLYLILRKIHLFREK